MKKSRPISFSSALFLILENLRLLLPKKKFSRTSWICLVFALYCSPIFALDPNQPLGQL